MATARPEVENLADIQNTLTTAFCQKEDLRDRSLQAMANSIADKPLFVRHSGAEEILPNDLKAGSRLVFVEDAGGRLCLTRSKTTLPRLALLAEQAGALAHLD